MTSIDGSVYNLYKISFQIPGLTSPPSTLAAKKAYEDEIFSRQDILQFFSVREQIFKIPTDVIGTLKPKTLLGKVVAVKKLGNRERSRNCEIGLIYI